MSHKNWLWWADHLAKEAECHFQEDRYVEAEHRLEAARAIYKRVLGNDDAKVVKCDARLGCTYVAQERYHEAESVLKRAIATTVATQGGDHLDMAYFVHCLGWLYLRWGRLSEARVNLELALGIQAKCAKKDPTVVSWLGDIYARQREYHRAEAFYEEAAALWAKEDAEHPAIRYAQAQLSACRWSQRALTKAAQT